MSDIKITKKRVYGGIWEGVAVSQSGKAKAPDLSVTHLEKEIQSVSVKKDGSAKNTWQVRVAIPPETLCDGVQVYMISDKDTGETLSSFTIVTGEPLEDDIRSEVELLRAELDLLKRAFRRHCLES